MKRYVLYKVIKKQTFEKIFLYTFEKSKNLLIFEYQNFYTLKK